MGAADWALAIPMHSFRGRGHPRDGATPVFASAMMRCDVRHGHAAHIRAPTAAQADECLRAPAVVLVRPQLDLNVGAVARAMANFGASDLRIVAPGPRCNHLSEDARRMAAGADAVLEAADVFETLDGAASDLSLVWATTSRGRALTKLVDTPREAAVGAQALEGGAHTGGGGVGVLFGCEASGLSNDEVARASRVMCVPTDPAFCSLNLAQAVLLVLYEWKVSADTAAGSLMAATDSAARGPGFRSALLDDGVQLSDLAPGKELDGLAERLAASLDASAFFDNVDNKKRASTMRGINNLIYRSNLSSAEVGTLQGILTHLGRAERK